MLTFSDLVSEVKSRGKLKERMTISRKYSKEIKLATPSTKNQDQTESLSPTAFQHNSCWAHDAWGG